MEKQIFNENKLSDILEISTDKWNEDAYIKIKNAFSFISSKKCKNKPSKIILNEREITMKEVKKWLEDDNKYGMPSYLRKNTND